jgi:hypothetical protein
MVRCAPNTIEDITMTRHHIVTCKWIKNERAAHKRALNARGYEGLGWRPINLGNYTYGGAARLRDRQNRLIAYATALAVKRGTLREGETCGALVVEFDGGEAKVKFYRYRTVRGRYGDEDRPEQLPFAEIELRNLDWVPADPVESIIPEGFEDALVAA